MRLMFDCEVPWLQ